MSTYDDLCYIGFQTLFGVDSDSGSIFVNNPLNREVVEEIAITVFVRDINAQQPPFQNATGIVPIVCDVSQMS